MTPTTEQLMTNRFLEPHQAQAAPPTDFENRLGDAIEAAMAQVFTISKAWSHTWMSMVL